MSQFPDPSSKTSSPVGLRASHRLSVESLEDRNLPGEGVLSLLAACCIAEFAESSPGAPQDELKGIVPQSVIQCAQENGKEITLIAEHPEESLAADSQAPLSQREERNGERKSEKTDEKQNEALLDELFGSLEDELEISEGDLIEEESDQARIENLARGLDLGSLSSLSEQGSPIAPVTTAAPSSESDTLENASTSRPSFFSETMDQLSASMVSAFLRSQTFDPITPATDLTGISFVDEGSPPFFAFPTLQSSSALREESLPGAPSRGLERFGSMPLFFEANVGQFLSDLDFVTRAGGYEAGFHSTGAIFVTAPPTVEDVEGSRVTANVERSIISMELVGGSTEARAIGLEPFSGVTNYLVGNDPSKHFTGVENYGRILYEEVYAGIDMMYYTAENNLLEYDFILSPGVSSDQIRLQFDGAEGLELSTEGNLILRTSTGDFVQEKPFSYQEINGQRQEVASEYVLTGDNEVAFVLGDYDASRELVVDPKWGYSTYLGGAGFDSGRSIDVDGNGNAYIVGETQSETFAPGNPEGATTTLEKVQNSILGEGGKDVFVAKLNAQGTAFTYLTFIGSPADDIARDIKVDDEGAAHITGYTNGTDFYVKNAFQATRKGNDDGFAVKLAAGGASAVYSTYLGGTGNDRFFGIDLSEDGRAFVVGVTKDSLQMGEITFGAATTKTPDKKFGDLGNWDVVVLSLLDTGVVESMYALGGDAIDAGRSIAVHDGDNIYITGFTYASGNNKHFPTTAGAFRSTPFDPQKRDAFVANIDHVNEQLAYSTIFGGPEDDNALDLVLDVDGVYVAGNTRTRVRFEMGAPVDGFKDQAGEVLVPDFLGANIFVPPPYAQDGWVAKFDVNGSPISPGAEIPHFFVYIRGRKHDQVHSLALAPGANPTLYVGGYTHSNPKVNQDSFAFKNELQTYLGNNADPRDAFLLHLDPTQGANTLLYATYLGGAKGADIVYGVASDEDGNVYVTGQTYATDFRKLLKNAVNGLKKTAPGGDKSNGFVVKITPDPMNNAGAQLNPLGNQIGTVGAQLTFTVTATDPDNDPVSFSVEDEPSGATIDSGTGQFSWAPDASHRGVHTFFVQAYDPDFRFDETIINVTISDPSSGPEAGDSVGAELPFFLLANVEAEVEGTIGDGLQGSLDVDLYSFSAEAGQTIILDVDAQELDEGGSLANPVDSYLRLFDGFGVELASNDNAVLDPDTGAPSAFDSALIWTAPYDGIYYVGVSGAPNSLYDPFVSGSGISGSSGDYRLQVRTADPEPAFDDELE